MGINNYPKDHKFCGCPECGVCECKYCKKHEIKMDDFRKNMHLAFKTRVVEMITKFLIDFHEEVEQGSQIDAYEYIVNWVNANCLPIGDFDKEKAIKEIEEWSK